MTAEIKLVAEAVDDLESLPPDIREQALRIMVMLRAKPLTGRPLSYHREVGDLSDCFKLYFNLGRHRIVYQLEAGADNEPARVLVLGVGERANLGVYRSVARRLRRSP